MVEQTIENTAKMSPFKRAASSPRPAPIDVVNKKPSRGDDASTSTHSTKSTSSFSSHSSTAVFAKRSRRLTPEAVPITPLERVPYVHGAYASCAPLFVRNERWMHLLQMLMPVAYNKVLGLIDTATPAKLMKWAEHNPVVSAYGVLQGTPAKQTRTTRYRTKQPNTVPLEWDVFLDPSIVKHVDRAIQKAQACEDQQSRIAAEVDVERQVGRLISRMLLAHGSTGQLMAEALGVAQKYNFSRVAQSTNPDSANRSAMESMGIFVDHWLHIFVAALKLGQRMEKEGGTLPTTWEELDHEYGSMVLWENPSLCGLFLCMGLEDPNSKKADHASNTMAANLKDIQTILGCPLKVVLDLKSRRVPPSVWGRLLDNLRSRGLHVVGIGSFDLKELRAISDACCTPITPMIFFHSAGDLQRASHAGELKQGDHVYFNAGSLLWQKPSFAEVTDMGMGCCRASDNEYGEASARFVVHPFAHPKTSVDMLPADLTTSTIEDYKRHFGIHVGAYIQEFSISQEALEVLINFVNFSPAVFDLGMAYGGLNGATVPGLEGDGLWNQRYLGRNWDLDTGPNDVLREAPEDNEIIHDAIIAVGYFGTLHEEDQIANAIQKTACARTVGALHGNPFDGSRLRQLSNNLPPSTPSR